MSTLCFLAMLSSTASSSWNQAHPPASLITLTYLPLLYVLVLTLQSTAELNVWSKIAAVLTFWDSMI